ncbi:MAG: CBS domain-containing protein [Sphingomonas sp.]|nr:CBS domain-containing protein [Sphingomonas sp.]
MAVTPSSRLEGIARKLRSGEDSPTITVRDFLWWFGAQRRGYWIVRQIKSRLQEFGLRTIPNFEYAWIDGSIIFELLLETDTEAEGTAEPVEVEISPTEGTASEGSGAIWVSREATYRISRLAAANKTVVSANPQEPLRSIITRMMAGGFSQLPVMQNDREVRGIVSWQTIGSRLALGVGGTCASDLSEPHHEIRSDRSIFDAIPTILASDYVLVRDDTNKISGIITAADLSLQFRELTEPFLLLSEIENLLRNLIGDRFSAEELAEACDSSDVGRGPVATIADLSFGEYIRLLQKPERWEKLTIEVDRVMFCEKLDQVRIIRNDVMHFDPDGVGESELTQLREFTRFLQLLMTVLGRKL